VLEVNHGGSTGFGRAFRDRLHLNWGIVDVDDCINGAKFLVAEGLVDDKRMVIRVAVLAVTPRWRHWCFGISFTAVRATTG
jgi:Prolyl oligopeptidase family